MLHLSFKMKFIVIFSWIILLHANSTISVADVKYSSYVPHNIETYKKELINILNYDKINGKWYYDYINESVYDDPRLIFDCVNDSTLQDTIKLKILNYSLFKSWTSNGFYRLTLTKIFKTAVRSKDERLRLLGYLGLWTIEQWYLFRGQLESSFRNSAITLSLLQALIVEENNNVSEILKKYLHFSENNQIRFIKLIKGQLKVTSFKFFRHLNFDKTKKIDKLLNAQNSQSKISTFLNEMDNLFLLVESEEKKRSTLKLIDRLNGNDSFVKIAFLNKLLVVSKEKDVVFPDELISSLIKLISKDEDPYVRALSLSVLSTSTYKDKQQIIETFIEKEYDARTKVHGIDCLNNIRWSKSLTYKVIDKVRQEKNGIVKLHWLYAFVMNWKTFREKDLLKSSVIDILINTKNPIVARYIVYFMEKEQLIDEHYTVIQLLKRKKIPIPLYFRIYESLWRYDNKKFGSLYDYSKKLSDRIYEKYKIANPPNELYQWIKTWEDYIPTSKDKLPHEEVIELPKPEPEVKTEPLDIETIPTEPEIKVEPPEPEPKVTKVFPEKKEIEVLSSDSTINLVNRWLKNYVFIKPDIKISATGGGSDLSIYKLINNRTDMAVTTRKMSPQEILEAKRNNLEIKEYKVALDILGIYVNKKNPINMLSIEQLKNIFSGKITTWYQINGWREKIIRFGRKPNSGPFHAFKKFVLGNKEYTRIIRLLDTNSDILSMISTFRGAIGFSQLKYPSSAKLITIKKDGMPLLINKDAFSQRKYPLYRYIYIYINEKAPDYLKEFIEWTLTEKNEKYLTDEGFVTLDDYKLFTALEEYTKKFQPPPRPTITAEIKVKGSDYVLPLGKQWAHRYMKENPYLKITVKGEGSRPALHELALGKIDMLTASAQISDEDKRWVESMDKVLVEHEVAIHALAIYVHVSNPLNEITLHQLQQIYRGNIRNWKELGGPDFEIAVYSREPLSVQWASFIRTVLNGQSFGNNVKFKGNDRDIMLTVSKDTHAIGYSFFKRDYSLPIQNLKPLKIKVDDEAEAYGPEEKVIEVGLYPLSRYYYIYTIGEPEKIVKSYLDWIKSNEGQRIVREMGFLPLPPK